MASQTYNGNVCATRAEETEQGEERESTDPREPGDVLMGTLALDADQ
jgi:predicted alternative tryptophan synthase beta-subunit